MFAVISPLICIAEADGPIATVKVAPLKKGTIQKTNVLYGTVVPAPGAVEAISVAYESQVKQILVSQGEPVSSGDSLLKMAPSPDTRLKVETARTNCQISKARLDEVKKRLHLKLATNDEVFQAQQAFTEADLQLKNYHNMGATGPATLKAESGGIIGTLYVQEGAVVQPGGPLAEIIAGGALEARLGGEVEDQNVFKSGQAVSLFPVNRPAAAASTGKIRTVSRSINPGTRLIDIFITPDDCSRLLLNEYVKGEITVAAVEGLIVPRSAVLRSNDKFSLFTVKNGRAIQHFVQKGLENEKDVQVISKELKPGDSVVILGNYELTDHMAVKVEESR